MENVPMFPEWEDEYGNCQMLFPIIEKAGETTNPPPPPLPLEPLADTWNWM